jgi:kynureninase
MAATTGLELLKEIEASSGLSKDSAEFAEYLDKHDTLSSTREQFDIPLAADGGIYFAAHALGACPKTVGKLLQEEVQAWSTV